MVRTYRTHMHPVLKNGDIRRICPNVLRGLGPGIRRANHEWPLLDKTYYHNLPVKNGRFRL